MREFDLLHHVYRSNSTLPATVVLPPGDDMGGVRIGRQTALVTVDQVADGVHFDLRTTSLARVARKALTRNLSDVAAMAAVPVGAVVAAALPRDFGQDRATGLFDAMRRVADSFRCPLFGGDITIWDHPLLVGVTVLAEPAGIEPLTRAGAQPGDLIVVTGRLGGSLEEMEGYVHHLDFEPRLQLARQLASNPHWRPRCMIDLSDGLARDLRHLCEAGHVSACVRLADLPAGPGAVIASKRDGRPPWWHALADGEDYELCFAVSPDTNLPGRIGGVPLTVVGRFTTPVDPPQVTLQSSDGSTQTAPDIGWEHRGGPA